MLTRRSLLQFTAVGIGTSAAAFVFPAIAAETTPLVDRAVAACRRLAPSGWRQLLLDVTGGELDLDDADLGTRLTQPLAKIDRTVPGFGDFDIAGTRPIEPGMPERSLLYHALAAPSVVAGRNGLELTSFPTLAEINAVEDFVYGAAPPSLEEIRARASGHRLGVVAFAVSYRNAPDAVYGTHAQLCFARAGMARLGTLKPLYDGRKRNFVSLDENKPYDFRVVPCRFVAYIAVRVPGTWSRFGPQDRLPDDSQRQFWVPLHKLFSGKECPRGLDLNVAFERGLRSDELGMFHRFLDTKGLENDFRGDTLEEYPFTIKDEKIGSLSGTDGLGAGVLVPLPQPLFSVAKYKGKDLAFRVDGSYSS